MSDYDNYREASGWLDPMAISLGMYGKRLQFIVFDSDGNRETVITGELKNINTETAWVSGWQTFAGRWVISHDAIVYVEALGADVTLPLQGKILWKEIP